MWPHSCTQRQRKVFFAYKYFTLLWCYVQFQLWLISRYPHLGFRFWLDAEFYLLFYCLQNDWLCYSCYSICRMMWLPELAKCPSVGRPISEYNSMESTSVRKNCLVGNNRNPDPRVRLASDIRPSAGFLLHVLQLITVVCLIWDNPGPRTPVLQPSPTVWLRIRPGRGFTQICPARPGRAAGRHGINPLGVGQGGD